MIYPTSSTKQVENDSSQLRISGPIGWIPADISQLRLAFLPELEMNIDYEISSDSHSLPSHYHYHMQHDLLVLTLLPGKRWVANSYNVTQDLILADIYCVDGLGNRHVSQGVFQPIVVARIIPSKSSNCVSLPVLPNISNALQQTLEEILSTCPKGIITMSKRLYWKKYHSLYLLRLKPPLMIIDGTDQTFFKAAKSVDNFLAAHAVMDIVWEPMTAMEQQWWILMPRPSGMPGHLFAIIDTVQWRHPLVSNYDRNTKCTRNMKDCVPGCPGTLVRRITASGYNADANIINWFFKHAIMDNMPMQVSPVRLGTRTVPPIWENIHAWTYTFQGCSSNFLDCYFLDHSPCPYIVFDYDHRNEASFNMSRTKAISPDGSYEMRPPWWAKTVGSPSDLIPEKSIADLTQHAIPTAHSFYSYLFRPNYIVRQEVYRRVQAFNLDVSQETCAVLHVRRGDILFHHGQGRSYMPVETYIRAAKPYIDKLQVTTILILSDSQAAIDEAFRCEKEFPSVCKGLKWRFVDKKRWIAGEGGWENPFPSGSAREEFMNIQLEFALAQKCDLGIFGDSGYGEKVYMHMCCGYPLQARGLLNQRCLCPPRVRLEQFAFDCAKGNALLCDGANPGGDITKPLNDPANSVGAKFSLTSSAYRNSTKVWLTPVQQEISFMLDDYTLPETEKELSANADTALKEACTKYDGSPSRKKLFCK